MSTQAYIKGIEYHLPEAILSNEMLSAENPDWSVEKIQSKTGISVRHIAAEGECSSDLGVAAAQKLFSRGICTPAEVDFLLFCTQSPDYFLPTTACLIQKRLEVSPSSGALDFNLGCSGFVYGLGLAKGLVETGQASNVLLITAETYSKFIHPSDKSVRTLFGDAAAATLISRTQCESPSIGPFVYGTDGSGAQHLMVESGGMRRRLWNLDSAPAPDGVGGVRSPDYLYMNGPEIFSFTIKAVPQAVEDILKASGLRLEDIDLFVFHQANRYMLDHLRKKIKISEDRFFLFLEWCGNTVSSTIPVALRAAQEAGRLKKGSKVMLVGFGVGFSWGAAMIRWEI